MFVGYDHSSRIIIITFHTFSQQMGRPKLDTVVGMAHSVFSIQCLDSPPLILDAHGALTYSSLLLQQQFSEALQDPKGSVCADRQDAEKQKAIKLICLSVKMWSQICLGKNNQAIVILHSIVKNQQQPTSRFYKTRNTGFSSHWLL